MENYIGKELYSVTDNYIVFDLETTGLSATRNEIIEIGAIKVENGKQVDTFDSYVKPKHKIPARATEVNGIENEDVEFELGIDDVLPGFLDFIGDYVLIAHNAKFDISFLSSAKVKVTDEPLQNNYIDTLKWARKIAPELDSHNLDSLIDFYGLEDEDRHSGLGDCVITNELYKHLVKDCLGRDIRIGHNKIIKQTDIEIANRIIAEIKPPAKKHVMSDEDKKASAEAQQITDNLLKDIDHTPPNTQADDFEYMKPVNIVPHKFYAQQNEIAPKVSRSLDVGHLINNFAKQHTVTFIFLVILAILFAFVKLIPILV